MTVPRRYSLSAVQWNRLGGLTGVMFAVMLMVAAPAGAARAIPAATVPASSSLLFGLTSSSLHRRSGSGRQHHRERTPADSVCRRRTIDRRLPVGRDGRSTLR